MHVPFNDLEPDELDQIIGYHARMMPAVTTMELYRHHETLWKKRIRQRRELFEDREPEIMAVAKKALEVFGSSTKAQHWLERRAECGLSLQQAVERLRQIEHGMAA